MTPIEPDLAEMMRFADDLDEAGEMLYLQEFLREFQEQNRIRKWIVSLMRDYGWRVAYERLIGYTDGGCGMRG